MTKELEKRFREVGSQEYEADPIIIAKFFSPVGSATWFAYEYDPDTRIAFGYVKGLSNDEFGSFSLDEMEQVELPYGLKIERDLYTSEKRLSEHCPELQSFIGERQKSLAKDKQRQDELNQIQNSKNRNTDLEIEK